MQNAEIGGKARSRSLTVTLALAFFSLSLAVILISSVLELYSNYQSQQQIIITQQTLIAQNAANTVRNFVQEKFSTLETAANLGDIVSASKEEQKLILDRLLGHEPAFRQIVLIGERDRIVAEVSRLSQATSKISSEHPSRDLFSGGENYISSVYIDTLNSEPMVIMAVPVADVFGDFQGIIAAEVNLKFMWDLMDSIKVGESGLAYVVDRQGNLIAFGDIGRVLKGENLAYLNEVDRFVKGDAANHKDNADISTGIRGAQVVANHAHLETPDWAVMVEMPIAEAYAPVFSFMAAAAFIVIVSALLAVLAGLYLAKRITKPIIKLSDVAEEIGKGNLDAKIEIRSKDEIGGLASALNRMAGDLKQSHAQIEKYTQDLEKKVKDRTSELDEKVRELTDTKTAVLNMMDDMDETNKELVKMQDELKESLDELKKVDVKKDEFISIAAHELKTPLTSIHGFSQLLLETAVSGDKEKRDKYLKIIDSETKRVSKLVTDILDLSRIDLGTIKLNPEEVDLSDLMANVQKEMNVQISAKGLKSEYGVEPGIRIFTDRERLTQVLLNLINNAVKYTPKGRITVKMRKEKGDVHFTITDTGIGIAKDQHDKLFRRFYQIDSSYTRKAGGTGLGLALCKEFVTIMGGRIWFASEFGKGSEFHFTLPLKGQETKVASERERAEEALKKSEKMTRNAKP